MKQITYGSITWDLKGREAVDQVNEKQAKCAWVVSNFRRRFLVVRLWFTPFGLLRNPRGDVRGFVDFPDRKLNAQKTTKTTQKNCKRREPIRGAASKSRKSTRSGKQIPNINAERQANRERQSGAASKSRPSTRSGNEFANLNAYQKRNRELHRGSETKLRTSNGDHGKPRRDFRRVRVVCADFFRNHVALAQSR